MNKALRMIAYHEAGHAVMNWYYNIGCKFVEIVSDAGDGLPGGRHRSQDPALSIPSRDERFRAMAHCAAAGTIAVAILKEATFEDMFELLCEKDLPDQTENDFANLFIALDITDYDGLFLNKMGEIKIEKACEEVVSILKNNWPAVEAVAEALLEQWKLSGQEAWKIIDSAIASEGR